MTTHRAIWGVPDADTAGKVWIVYQEDGAYRVGWETADDSQTHSRIYAQLAHAQFEARRFAGADCDEGVTAQRYPSTSLKYQLGIDPYARQFDVYGRRIRA